MYEQKNGEIKTLGYYAQHQKLNCLKNATTIHFCPSSKMNVMTFVMFMFYPPVNIPNRFSMFVHKNKASYPTNNTYFNNLYSI